jgi:hypothetical protein
LKRYWILAFAIILLGVLSTQAVTVKAVNSAYGEQFYLAINNPTVDGKWTATNEWTDAGTPTGAYATGSFIWMEKWAMPASDIIGYVLIEDFAVTTATANDYVQYCYDPSAAGGAAPSSSQILFNYTGHGTGAAGLSLYKGTGTGWSTTKWTGYTYGTDLSISDSMTATPLNSTVHWVIEIMMDRSNANFDSSGAGYAPCLRVSVYSASTGTLAWPAGSSADVPNGWGQETGVYANIPEKMPIVPIVILSSIAVIVSLCVIQKRPKTKA